MNTYSKTFITFTFLVIAPSYGFEVEKVDFLLPTPNPSENELWLCSSIRINSSAEYNIVGFEPRASMDRVHHFLLYTCSTPGSRNSVWNCKELSQDATSSELETADECTLEGKLIFAWARNAPSLMLPADVGFKVGGHTPHQYMVLHVHYAAIDQVNHLVHDSEIPPYIPPVDPKNRSGLVLHVTKDPVKMQAGVFFLGATGVVPPHSTARWEVSCPILENKTMHPFAFRPHTHELGTVVKGYRVRADGKGKHHWTLIGKKNPQKPHMFYPVKSNITVNRGDIMAARCSYYSNRDNVTESGFRFTNEMCNFYTMYYVENGDPLKVDSCTGTGKFWDSRLNNIPADASDPE